MYEGSEEKADILWRLAPWLTLVAMTMTVLSQSPAESAGHQHAQDRAGQGCGEHGSAHGHHHAAMDVMALRKNAQPNG